MDAAHGHFFAMVGDLCANAQLAHLSVEAFTRDGRVVRGVPQPQAADSAAGGDEVDHTGFARDMLIGEERVALDAIVELRILVPESNDSP